MMDGSSQKTSGTDHQYAAASLSRHDDAKAAEGPRTKGSRAQPSRAVRLLQQLIDRELASSEALACALAVSPRQLEEYLTGLSRLPLHSQRRLAELIISSAPELAREARRLRLQCNAAEVFYAKETQTHMIAPPNRFR